MKNNLKIATILISGSLTTPLFATWEWQHTNIGQIMYACSPEVISDTKLDPPYHNVVSQFCLECSNWKDGPRYTTSIFFTDSNIVSRKAKLHLGGGEIVPIVIDGGFGIKKVGDPIDKGKQLLKLSPPETEKFKSQLSTAVSLMLEVEWDTSWSSSLFGGSLAWFNYPMRGYKSATYKTHSRCVRQPFLDQ